MCQMYAIFEEVVAPQPSVTFAKNLQNPGGDDQGIVVDCGDQQATADQESTTPETTSQYGGSGKPKPKKSPSKHTRTHRIKNSATLPRYGRRRLPSNSDDDASTTSSSNPLLDTISVLTYDPPDDSDEYYDLTCGTKEENVKQAKSASTSQRTEGDRDSIGYAGSSSIDSGYKSFCPTPELTDSSFYGTDRTQQYSGYYTDSTRGKPRIMMGTRLMSRQASPSTVRDLPASRRSDASLYDVNLDHLMYLRQSLLSAIQKCESSKSETVPVQRSSSNLVEDQRYSDYPPSKNTGYQKTVRFNTDVKVSTVNSSQPPCENSSQSHSRTGDFSSDSVNKVQSKSILKDPLCANLRSQLEAGSADCTLEEEIDSLLYGRAEFYDLESVDEFPCSYVTMIEEKYKSGKPSLAKVRKLKGGKPSELPPKLTKTSDTDKTSPISSTSTEDEDSSSQKSSKDNNSSSSSTVSISKTAKCRFTEVARCMLEIIEDLQMKKMQPEAAAKDASSATPDASQSSSEDKPSEDSASSTTGSKSQFYSSAAEYHVYEEIDYDCVKELPILKAPDIPPPLPARPTTLLVKTDQQHSRAPSPPPRKSRCALKKSPQTLDVSADEVRNRPKQRGNLYCLFSDRAERRNISRSLEREFKVSGTDNQDDDYGFRKEFVSI